MSTILDALRRLQAERASGPGVDPREALGRRNLAPSSGRVALRGIGLGAVLGAASVALLTALWLLSGAVFPSTAGEPPQGEPGEIVLAQATPPLLPAQDPAARAAAERVAPEDEPYDAPELKGETTADADNQADPGTPLSGPAAARLQRVRLDQDQRGRASDPTARAVEPASEPPQEESSGFQAIAERRSDSQPPPPAATAETSSSGVSSLAPPRPPASTAAQPRARPPAAGGPRPGGTPPRATRTRPATPMATPSNLTPGRSTPPAGQTEYVDPVAFPILAVNSVRWHPDPGRRQATVEVDGVVAIAAREGELVGGALLSRIDPGQVEFRIGTRVKVVPVGK